MKIGILWENLHLDRTAKAQKVELMFIPVYRKPFTYGTNGRRIPYVRVIHDIQALYIRGMLAWAVKQYLGVFEDVAAGGVSG